MLAEPFQGPASITVSLNGDPQRSPPSIDMDLVEDINGDESFKEAKQWAFKTMGKGGLAIIKHGRQGKPQNRRLQCDFQVTKLFCRSNSVYKDVNISHIQSIRRGTDIDPASPVHPDFTKPAPSPGINNRSMYSSPPTSPTGDSLIRMKSGVFFSAQSNPSMGPGLKRKKSLLEQGAILYGTLNLRRNCKPEDMPMCLSLILPDRTFDIQFTNKKDLEEFHKHMSVLIARNAKISPGESFYGYEIPSAPTSTTSLQIQDSLIDEDIYSALDCEFLIQQGYTEEQIQAMFLSVREEALLRSKKTEHIRQTISLASVIDDAPETDDDDELSEEDQRAVQKLIDDGYSEEQALQIHLQNLHLSSNPYDTNGNAKISGDSILISIAEEEELGSQNRALSP